MENIQNPSNEPRPSQTNIQEGTQSEDHRQGKEEETGRASKQINRRRPNSAVNGQQTMSIQCGLVHPDQWRYVGPKPNSANTFFKSEIIRHHGLRNHVVHFHS